VPGMSETASELASISRHLRRAGQGELVRDLERAIRRAVEPVRGEIRRGLGDHVPSGYVEELNSDLSLTVSVRTAAGNPGVELWARNRSRARKLRDLNSGVLRHPAWGHRERRWVPQTDGVRPGFFTKPCENAAPRVHRAIVAALADVEARAVRKGP
jgi:hypothetical protein